MSKTLGIDFGENNEPKNIIEHHEKIITDRKSVYSVSIGKVHKRKEAQEFLKEVKKQKNHHKATHHSFAMRISKDGIIYESKNDGGETGAGQVILRVLQKNHMVNTVVCVTRWFGGVKLEGDRFKHLQDATIYAIERAVS